MNSSDLSIPENINIGGIQIIDIPGFLELFLRFSLNIAVLILLVRWLYYSTSRRKDYLFTYILIPSVIFLITFLLANVKLQLGFALGLFAVFGIIRYRTDSMPIREMTYLFLVIGISVINALTSTKTSLADLLFTNLVLVGITYGFERIWLLKYEIAKVVVYEKIDMIRPENHEELLKDLSARTGIPNITRVEMGKIDFLRDTCTLVIFYESDRPEMFSHKHLMNGGDDDE